MFIYNISISCFFLQTPISIFIKFDDFTPAWRVQSRRFRAEEHWSWWRGHRPCTRRSFWTRQRCRSCADRPGCSSRSRIGGSRSPRKELKWGQNLRFELATSNQIGVRRCWQNIGRLKPRRLSVGIERKQNQLIWNKSKLSEGHRIIPSNFMITNENSRTV